jgi:hypothetical protein
MQQEFWGSKRWRYDRWIWGGVLLLITLVQLLVGQPARVIFLLLCLSGVCFFSAWRRSKLPFYTVTDNELLMGTGGFGKKRILWSSIKDIQQDAYGVRLIGREWFGGTSLSLTALPKAERDEFLQLVREKVDAANATYGADT